MILEKREFIKRNILAVNEVILNHLTNWMGENNSRRFSIAESKGGQYSRLKTSLNSTTAFNRILTTRGKNSNSRLTLNYRFGEEAPSMDGTSVAMSISQLGQT